LEIRVDNMWTYSRVYLLSDLSRDARELSKTGLKRLIKYLAKYYRKRRTFADSKHSESLAFISRDFCSFLVLRRDVDSVVRDVEEILKLEDSLAPWGENPDSELRSLFGVYSYSRFKQVG